MSRPSGAAFVLRPEAWAVPEVRHVASVMASLLTMPARVVPPGEALDAGEAPVEFGDPAHATAQAAAFVVVRGWEPWTPSRVVLREHAGLMLPAADTADAGGIAEGGFPAWWLRGAGWMLHREEESAVRHRDEWGCFSGFSTRLHELNVLETPLVNRMAEQLERRVEAWLAARHLTAPRRPRWKGEARFAVALTHDVDVVRYFSFADAGRLLRRSRGPRSYAFRRGLVQAVETLAHVGRSGDPFWNFDRWIEDEERFGFRSSFYFLPTAPTRPHEFDGTYAWDDPVGFEGEVLNVRGLLRRLSERGAEVGLHGSYLSHLDGTELAHQRRQLEQALGAPVRGVRQHFLRFDAGETWRAQQQAGFEYDATLGYNEALGFRAGIAAPFHPWDPRARAPLELLALPLTAMDGVLFRTWKLDRELATRRLIAHLDEVERAGGLAVLLWHPNAADARRYPGWYDTWRDALEYLASRPAWVAPAGEIARWWRERPGESA